MQKLTFIGIAALAAALLALVPAAFASGGKGGGGGGGNRAVIKRGTCSVHSTFKLKAKADDGRIEAEFEVDQNRVGKRWRVTLTRNGASAFSGIRTTLAPSGSFSLHRLLAASAGGNRIVASATALKGGETCRASISL
jgi:hypothetical protein